MPAQRSSVEHRHRPREEQEDRRVDVQAATLSRAGPSRHPAEVPFFIFMVVLNVLIIALIVQAAVVLPFLPATARRTPAGRPSAAR